MQRTGAVRFRPFWAPYGRVSASLPEAMKQFTRVDKTYRCTTNISRFIKRRYEAYLALQQAARLIQ